MIRFMNLKLYFDYLNPQNFNFSFCPRDLVID